MKYFSCTATNIWHIYNRLKIFKLTHISAKRTIISAGCCRAAGSYRPQGAGLCRAAIAHLFKNKQESLPRGPVRSCRRIFGKLAYKLRRNSPNGRRGLSRRNSAHLRFQALHPTPDRAGKRYDTPIAPLQDAALRQNIWIQRCLEQRPVFMPSR